MTNESAQDTQFARLVSLACHDLRTPLATVHGFARTLRRLDGFDEQAERYIEFIDAASEQLADLLDDLSLVARIEARRYDPNLRSADTLELAESAAARLGGKADASGTGAEAVLDVDATESALAALGLCAIRHGGVEHVTFAVDGPEIGLSPIAPDAGPIILGEELRDLGAAVAVRLVRRLGGSVELEEDTLRIRLPVPE